MPEHSTGSSPDTMPSLSGMVAEDTDRGPIWAFKVKSLGVLVIREAGISTFTTDQLQFSDLDNKTTQPFIHE